MLLRSVGLLWFFHDFVCCCALNASTQSLPFPVILWAFFQVLPLFYYPSACFGDFSLPHQNTWLVQVRYSRILTTIAFFYSVFLLHLILNISFKHGRKSIFCWSFYQIPTHLFALLWKKVVKWDSNAEFVTNQPLHFPPTHPYLATKVISNLLSKLSKNLFCPVISSPFPWAAFAPHRALFTFQKYISLQDSDWGWPCSSTTFCCDGFWWDNW